MEVYEFEKNFLDRMTEARNVLCWRDAVIPAAQVRREWSCFVELQIEPIGWQALWKIPRVICEELNLRFPTVVFGYVDQVLFKELKAVFVVTAVQDDDVHIPERNEVALIDLWPTIDQENDALNVDSTADCLDRLRFFYTHIWMPWDNESDNDRDWVEQHLESRIKLACDLNAQKVSRALSIHIRTLLAEARYLQQRVEYLELDLSDDEADSDKENSLVQVSMESDKNDADKLRSLMNDPDQSLNKPHVTDLMRLHLRLSIIRSEIDILENAAMRQVYEAIQSEDDNQPLVIRRALEEGKPHAKICYVVMKPCILQRQLELMQLARQHVTDERMVQLYPTLQDVLKVCHPTDDILLSPGVHTLKFLQYLNDNGAIKGLLDNRNDAINTSEPLNANGGQVIVTSSDDDSILIVVSGDFTLEQLVLDCRHVRTGILLKSGKLHMRHCRLIGDNRHSTQQAIFCSANARLVLEDCLVESFATGISLQNGASVSCTKLNIKHCDTAIELLNEDTRLELNGKDCKLSNCKVGIYGDGILATTKAAKAFNMQHFKDLSSYNEANWSGDCIFQDCVRNIYVLSKQKQLCSKKTLQLMLNDNDDKENMIL